MEAFFLNAALAGRVFLADKIGVESAPKHAPWKAGVMWESCSDYSRPYVTTFYDSISISTIFPFSTQTQHSSGSPVAPRQRRLGQARRYIPAAFGVTMA